jgi:hypothetical protein
MKAVNHESNIARCRVAAPTVFGLLIFPLAAAHAPTLAPTRASTYTSNVTSAFYHDFPRSKDKPCLIGAGSCIGLPAANSLPGVDTALLGAIQN